MDSPCTMSCAPSRTVSKMTGIAVFSLKLRQKANPSPSSRFISSRHKSIPLSRYFRACARLNAAYGVKPSACRLRQRISDSSMLSSTTRILSIQIPLSLGVWFLLCHCPPLSSTSVSEIFFNMDICIITETHTQTRKLHAVSVFVSYPPFFDSIFRQTNTPFNQNRQYPTPFYLPVLCYHGNP